MAQFNLQQTNSTGSATRVVSAGDPVTLVLNHSTKNTVYIGSSSSVGSGNLLDATPLDPYASIVVNGVQDVWAVAAVLTEEATVYTYQNAINWTPKAVQPNIVDPSSPWEPGTGTASETVAVPPGAQGVMITEVSGAMTGLSVIGVQSDVDYADISPVVEGQQYWIPILSDADTEVKITSNATTAPEIVIVWIMNTLPVSVVNTGVPIEVQLSNSQVTIANTPLLVQETNVQIYSMEEPIAFDMTLAASASDVLLPAVAGTQYFIHDIRVEAFTPGEIMYAGFQDTTPHTFARIYQDVDGTPANAYRPAVGINNFHGAPIPVGLGVQLFNFGTVSMRFVGYITYSEFI